MPNRFCAADNETPTLVGATVPAAVDYKRRSRSNWRSACFIIGVEIAERFAYYGISANLVSYLTGQLGQSTAAAAANVNAWHGTVALLPLLGASVADSFLGRYRTIVMASVLYILGLSLLTLSATLPSPSSFDHCETDTDKSCSRSHLQEILFFASLYLVAVAQGGHKPCTQAFGADQFDDQDRRERNAKGSFFNWWYFSVCAGAFVTKLTVSYIQDNLSWALGFGIPCVAMGIALAVFLLGTTTYRYGTARSERSPFVRIGSVFMAAFKSRRASSSAMANEAECCTLLPLQSNEQLRFLNKALLAPNHLNEEDSRVSREAEVEEAKAVLRLVPIWATCLIYAIVHAQSTTFFTKQGATMERTIAWGFKIPAASLQCFISLTILVSVPIYDRVFVPIARSFTGKPSGITTLQRVGSGIFLSAFAMLVAALVETKRLKTARQYGLLDKPSATIPMSAWWLVPQYILAGIVDVFAVVGLQEFFYDQVPSELRSVGLALYLSVILFCICNN